MNNFCLFISKWNLFLLLNNNSCSFKTIGIILCVLLLALLSPLFPLLFLKVSLMFNIYHDVWPNLFSNINITTTCVCIIYLLLFCACWELVHCSTSQHDLNYARCCLVLTFVLMKMSSYSSMFIICLYRNGESLGKGFSALYQVAEIRSLQLYILDLNNWNNYTCVTGWT